MLVLLSLVRVGSFSNKTDSELGAQIRLTRSSEGTSVRTTRNKRITFSGFLWSDASFEALLFGFLRRDASFEHSVSFSQNSSIINREGRNSHKPTTTTETYNHENLQPFSLGSISHRFPILIEWLCRSSTDKCSIIDEALSGRQDCRYD